MALTRRGVLAGAVTLGTLRRARAQADDGFQAIRAQKVRLPLLEDTSLLTPAWSLMEGTEPLVIRARQGEELKLRFENALGHDIWLHFFGIRGPADLMTINVPPEPGTAVECVFTPPDAGTFWLGPVADVSLLRDMGLYAMLVVEEAERPSGIEDHTIVLDDWKIADDGAVIGGFGDIEAMVGEGRLGNWITVNGRYRPRFKLSPARTARLRILNAANVRTMGLLFKGQDPLLIALDGQPLRPRQLDRDSMALAPGQRADLLMNAEADGIVMAVDLFEDIVEIAYFDRAGAGAPQALAENFELPANPLTLEASGEARKIDLVLEGGIKGGLKSARFGGVTLDLRSLLEKGKGWAINGVAGPSPEPAFRAARDEAILLNIENRTAFAQPLHIHGHVWREFDRGRFGDWRDTAIVAAGGVKQLALVADNPGIWAIHSLAAERSDGGLIASFTVG